MEKYSNSRYDRDSQPIDSTRWIIEKAKQIYSQIESRGLQSLQPSGLGSLDDPDSAPENKSLLWRKKPTSVRDSSMKSVQALASIQMRQLVNEQQQLRNKKVQIKNNLTQRK